MGKENQPDSQNGQSLDSETLSTEDQLKVLRTFVQEGYFQGITSERFSSIEPDFLVTSRITSAIIQVRQIAQNAAELNLGSEQLENHIGRLNKIVENISSVLYTDVVNDQNSTTLTPASAADPFIRFCVDFGLPDMLKPKFIPALGFFPEEDVDHLRSIAQEVRSSRSLKQNKPGFVKVD